MSKCLQCIYDARPLNYKPCVNCIEDGQPFFIPKKIFSIDISPTISDRRGNVIYLMTYEYKNRLKRRHK